MKFVAICALLLVVTISVVKTDPIPQGFAVLKAAPAEGGGCNGCHCCNGSCAGYCNGCAGCPVNSYRGVAGGKPSNCGNSKAGACGSGSLKVGK